MAITCPNCSTENPEDARFCMNCGHSLESPCPNCATALPSNARSCFNCGFEIEAGATTGEAGRSALEVTDDSAEGAKRTGALAALLGVNDRAGVLLDATGRPEARRFADVAADTVAEISASIKDPELRKSFLRTHAAR